VLPECRPTSEAGWPATDSGGMGASRWSRSRLQPASGDQYVCSGWPAPDHPYLGVFQPGGTRCATRTPLRRRTVAAKRRSTTDCTGHINDLHSGRVLTASVRPPVPARLTGRAQDQGKLRYDEKSLPGKGRSRVFGSCGCTRGRYRPPWCDRSPPRRARCTEP